MATDGTRRGSRRVPPDAPGSRRESESLLKTCEIAVAVPETLARQAACSDAWRGEGQPSMRLSVAFAEPGGTVLTSDPDDLKALADHAADVVIERI